MKKKKSFRHVASLPEELTEPSLNGIRSQTRQKRLQSKDETSAAVPSQLCETIYQEAKQQRQDVEMELQGKNTSSATGSLLLTKSLNAAFAKIEEDDDQDEDEDLEGEVMSYGMGEIEQLTAEDEKALALFSSGGAEQRQSFGEVIFEKIENLKKAKRKKKGEKDPNAIDANVVKLYGGVGDLLSRYAAGRIPRALRFVPVLANWEEVLCLTRPDKWTPHAYFAVTKLFLNSNPRMAQRYMNRILLPHLRQEIETRQRLHLALYEALKRCCRKAGAFYKGIIIPLCKSGTCTVREAVIFSSVIKRQPLPVEHSAAALLCLAEMPYSGYTSFFIQTLLEKNYALPFKALDGMVEHFMRFEDERRELPAIWHQSLLMFVQKYKTRLKQEDLSDLRRLVKSQNHERISNEIYKEIDHALGLNSRKADDAVDSSTPMEF